MRSRFVRLGCSIFLFAMCLPCLATETLTDGELKSLVELYKDFHAAPESSHHEQRTSARLAAELRKAGYTVTERVGQYVDGSRAYGVVAMLENGPGPRLLLRAELDALPVVEETGLSYASHVAAIDERGQRVGLMHACGHDIHATVLIGTARALAKRRAEWRGTLMLIGQPAEETIDGAKAMMADGLYDRFGTPDFAVALHDTNLRPAGTIAIASGPALASATSIDVVLRGVGGHGAWPQLAKDPIVMAGEFIVQLQTIVSRQQDPRDPAVVTIGDIHGGTKRNVISDEVRMELTARAFNDHARRIVIDGVRRTAAGVALAAGVPTDRAPIVTVLEAESAPAMYNDPALAARVKAVAIEALGSQSVFDEGPMMGSEDFGVLGLEGHKIPSVWFWLGAMDPAELSAAFAQDKSLPGLHSSRFAPLPEPTLRTGVAAMTAIGIALLNSPAG